MSDKKRFLHICLSESWGGLEMAVSRWNQILQENGHSNFNICTPESPLSEDLKAKGQNVNMWDSAPYLAPDFTLKLRRMIQKEKIHVVLIQNLRELWIIAPALWGLKDVKLIGFTQMLIGIKKKDFLHRLIYKRLDQVLTLTDWQKKALLPYLPIPASKYKTIPNFVDCQRFHPGLRSDDYRYQLGYKPEHFLIGIVGRIDKQKGQMELLEAFQSIGPDFPSARLLVVGEPTMGENQQEEYFVKIKNFVRSHKLEKQVQFYGFQKEPHKVFANLDLFVLPSYRETFGYVVVEAMASGTPVLGTRAGGVPEILGDSEYGFLCEPKSSDSIAQELRKILSQPQLRQENSQKALARARDFFERQRVYERFIQLLS